MMILPLRTDSPMRRRPYMNWALIAANFAVFFVEKFYNSRDPGDSAFVQPLILQAADPHLWQYFTYAFLHAGWLHIIGNMLFLYIFGNNINDRLGHLGYLAFYLAGAVFAGVGFVLVDPRGAVLGASGAVAAVTGAYLILLPCSNITILYWFFFFIGATEIASLWFILFYFLMDVVEQFFPGWFGGAEAVAHAAHISGTLFGIALCTLMLMVGLLPRDKFDVVALAQRWRRRRDYRGLVRHGYDPFGFSRPAGNQAPGRPKMSDAQMQQLMELRGRISQAVSDHDLSQAITLYQQLIGLDPDQVLSRTAQLDISNFLASQQLYPQAAAAYEQFQRFYPKYDQIEQVQLMLGVIYARYLHQPQRAKEYLLRALARLHAERDIALARSELAQVAPDALPSPPPA